MCQKAPREEQHRRDFMGSSIGGIISFIVIPYFFQMIVISEIQLALILQLRDNRFPSIDVIAFNSLSRRGLMATLVDY